MKFTLIIDDEKKTMKIREKLTIKDVLKDFKIPLEAVVVKKNGEIVVEEEQVNDGDIIEVIKVIYGG
ncbi:MAG: MoaD/ThiS family protein [Methanothermobacter sp.]|nr:MoaD/ThiS family protein [Methanothermobacter sp.]